MAMPNIADIALQLDNFIKDVQTRVDTWPVFQTEFKTRGPQFAKDRKLQIYEACLNKLSSDQRAQFEHILNELIKPSREFRELLSARLGLTQRRPN
jgi:hypothetical protein